MSISYKIPLWENLKVLAVQPAAGGTTLFANGRQQTKLLIKLQVVGINGDTMRVSDTELKSLQLIEYHGNTPVAYDPIQYGAYQYDPVTYGLMQYDPEEYEKMKGGRIPFNPTRHDQLQYQLHSGLRDGPQWMWTYLHNTDFSFFPSRGEQAAPDLEQIVSDGDHVYYRDAYVRSISQTPLRIALQITRDDGTIFRSNDPDMEKGSVILNTVPMRAYRASDYTFQRVSISGDPESKRVFDSIDYYPVTLIDSGVELKFRRFSISPKSIYRFDVAPRNRGSYTGYSHPGDEYFNYNKGLRNAPLRMEPTFKKRGGVVLVLVRQGSIPIVPGVDTPEPPAIIKALDTYGNEHQVGLRFQGEGRKYLELF
jgi:hypothetical protein